MPRLDPDDTFTNLQALIGDLRSRLSGDETPLHNKLALLEAMELQIQTFRSAEASAAKCAAERFAGLRHPFRTPILAISGYLSLLERELPKDAEKLLGYVGDIEAAANHLGNLINELVRVQQPLQFQ